MILLTFLLLVFVGASQAVCSSIVNRGGPAHMKFIVFGFGLAVSALWVMLSRYSTNLVRDGLVWDVLVAVTYSFVFIFMGHTQDFGLKHWVGIFATFGVFVYWSVIK